MPIHAVAAPKYGSGVRPRVSSTGNLNGLRPDYTEFWDHKFTNIRIFQSSLEFFNITGEREKQIEMIYRITGIYLLFAWAVCNPGYAQNGAQAVMRIHARVIGFSAPALSFATPARVMKETVLPSHSELTAIQLRNTGSKSILTRLPKTLDLKSSGNTVRLQLQVQEQQSGNGSIYYIRTGRKMKLQENRTYRGEIKTTFEYL